MTAQDVYAIEDPTLIGDYMRRGLARSDWRNGTVDAAVALHPDARPFGTGPGLFSDRGKIEGIACADGDFRPPPAGWRWVVSRRCYRPRQGKVGKPAQDWLDALPEDPGTGLTELCKAAGLPRTIFTDHRVFGPGVELYPYLGIDEDPERLWIVYGTRLDAHPDDLGELTLAPGVRQARLSEYHAAREADAATTQEVTRG